MTTQAGNRLDDAPEPGCNGRMSKPSRLRALFVGTGRDGTLSLSQMVAELFEREGAGRRVMHEYAGRECYDAFANFAETGDRAYLDEARRLILECPYDCVVGNGYAPLLPLIAECCGPELMLVHVRRLDRGACIRSLMQNCEFFPLAFGNYSDSPQAVTKRMAAFHFGEGSRSEWADLPLDAKLSWYFDKTHALIDDNSVRFTHRHEIHTERINDGPTRALVGAILGLGDGPPPSPTHLNAQAHIAALPSDRREKVQWLMGRFDIRRAADDDLYAADYFLNAFIAWTGYQIRGSEAVGPADTRSFEQLAELLERAGQLLDHNRRLVGLLEAERLERQTAGS